MDNNEQKELSLEEKARLAHNAYQRKWAKEHPDKIRKYQLNAYAKMYDKLLNEVGESDAK